MINEFHTLELTSFNILGGGDYFFLAKCKKTQAKNTTKNTIMFINTISSSLIPTSQSLPPTPELPPIINNSHEGRMKAPSVPTDTIGQSTNRAKQQELLPIPQLGAHGPNYVKICIEGSTADATETFSPSSDVLQSATSDEKEPQAT